MKSETLSILTGSSLILLAVVLANLPTGTWAPVFIAYFLGIGLLVSSFLEHQCPDFFDE